MLQNECCFRLVRPVERNGLRDIDIGERVAGNDNKGVVLQKSSAFLTDPAVPSGVSSTL